MLHGFCRGSITIYYTEERVSNNNIHYMRISIYRIEPLDLVLFYPSIYKTQCYNWSGKDHDHHQQRCNREKKVCHQK